MIELINYFVCHSQNVAPSVSEASCHSQSIVRCIVLARARASHQVVGPVNKTTISGIIQLDSLQSVPIELSPVMIAAYSDRLCLVALNGDQSTFQASQIVHCGVLSARHHQFSLMVQRIGPNNGSNTHSSTTTIDSYILAIDDRLARSHWSHAPLASKFNFVCNEDPINGKCLEFSGKKFA